MQQLTVGEPSASDIEFPERLSALVEANPSIAIEMVPFQLHALDMNYPDPHKEMEAELTTLKIEVNRLRTRNRALEIQLSLKEGQVRRWLKLTANEPETQTLKTMAEMLQDYPVELKYEEGLWMVERIEKDDWLSFGPTVDEAIFDFLGAARLQRELTPEQFENVKP